MRSSVIGAYSLKTKLDKISKLDLTKALNQVGIFVENKAKINCPVNTGHLRNSIAHEVEDNEVAVGTNVDYAPYVEFGTGLFAADGDGRKDVPWVYQDAAGNWHSTSGQHPQPYLLPALEDSTDEIEEVFKTVIKEGIADA